MTVRSFNVDDITRILDNPDEIMDGTRPLQDVQRTGKTFDDGIEEEWQAVFHDQEDDKIYRVNYRQAGAYARSRGSDVGYFDHIQGDTVECIEVVPKQVITTIYETAP